MRKIFKLSFIVLFLSGCGIHYLVGSGINNIPINKDSTLSVIGLEPGGTLDYATSIYLAYHGDYGYYILKIRKNRTRIYKKHKKNKKLRELKPNEKINKIQLRTFGSRMYIFNLPQRTYYIIGLDDDGYGLTALYFEKEYYEKYPLVIKKDKVNLLGIFEPKRKHPFTNKGKITKIDEMDIKTEKVNFIIVNGKNNEWVKKFHEN